MAWKNKGKAGMERGKDISWKHFRRYERKTAEEMERFLIYFNELFHFTIHFTPLSASKVGRNQAMAPVLPGTSQDLTELLATLIRKTSMRGDGHGTLHINEKVILWAITRMREGRKRGGGALFFTIMKEGDLPSGFNISYSISFLKATAFLFRILMEKNREAQELYEEYAQVSKSTIKKDAELIAKEREKGEFIVRITHELKTPLNSVLGYSEMLLSGMYGPVTQKQVEALQGIMERGYHLLDIITQILEFSKLDKGELILRLERFSIPRMIEENVKIARGLIKGKDVAISCRVHKGIGEITQDRNKLSHILLNLLSNAVKFTPHGGIKVAVRPFRKGWIKIDVSDTGVGIREEFLKDLFEPYQVDARGISDTLTGTGLGLSIVKRFTEILGGIVKVRSEYGSGSTFTVMVPDMDREEGGKKRPA